MAALLAGRSGQYERTVQCLIDLAPARKRRVPQMGAAMLDVTQLPLETETTAANEPDSKPCAQCGRPFVPRSRSGGSPQRFCCSDCRRGGQRHQRRQHDASVTSITPALQPASPASPPACEPASQAAEPTAKQDFDSFDWINDESVILHEQPATAIYFNPKEGLVIRQRSGDFYDDRDPFVVINAENIEDFLNKLLELCGRGKT
jgi:hypothetical protein